MEYNKLIKENALPYNAKKIGIYNENGEKVSSVHLDKSLLKEKGKRLYRFGVLSDIHHDTTYDQFYYDMGISQPSGITNETYISDGNQFSASDFANALNFFEEKDSVEFTCITGDLTFSMGGTGHATLINKETGERFTPDSYLTDFDSYKHNVELISPTTPVFPTKGNHDVASMDDIMNKDPQKLTQEMLERGCNSLDELWNYYATPKNYENLPYEFHFFGEDKNLNRKVFDAYYFIKTLNNGRKDLFIFLPVLTQEFWDSYPNHEVYDNDVVNWIDNVLSNNMDKRCFVFTHIFLNPNVGFSGNFKNIYTGMNGWYGSNQHMRILQMMETYKNSIWFHGHSHFVYELQNEDDTDDAKHCNISSKEIKDGISIDTAYSVHVGSCAYPRVLNDTKDGSHFNNNMSQGMVVDVYDDHIETRGITFSNGSRSEDKRHIVYDNLYEPIAHYWIDTI